MTSYLPSQDEMLRLAGSAQLPDVGSRNRSALIQELREPQADWDERFSLSVPGPVWTVVSDTCMTGRPYAPANIGYDNIGQEFVFRQPRDGAELAGVMTAACNEVFDCYRFDGLKRWTPATVWTWRNQQHVVEGWLRHVLLTEKDTDFLDSAEAYLSYLTSSQMREDLKALAEHLEPSSVLRRLRRRGRSSG